MADYTKAQIINMVDIIFRSGNLPELFNQTFVNYVGNTSDTNDAYMEVIADYLVERKESFKNYFSHKTVTRQTSYRTMEHDREWPGFSMKPPVTDENRRETISKCLFIESDWDDEIGKMLDYQMPVDDSFGETKTIDLVSFNEKQNKIRLINVVPETSEDTLLSRYLETFTYAKKLDFAKLQSDFKITSNPTLSIAILVHKGSPIIGQFELKEIKNLFTEMEIPVELFTWDFDNGQKRKFEIKTR